jgi:hypothetical protein
VDDYQAWLERELAAGRDPDEELLIFDDAAEELEPPDDDEQRPGFGYGGPADLLPPGPLLAGLTEQAVAVLGLLSDDELTGVLQATRRQIAREQYKQVLVTAEFGRRRRDAFEDAARRGVPVGCRPGGFPGEELAAELVVTRAEAGHAIDDAIDLTSRLPQTLAGMAAGQIDAERAGWIALYTRSLSEADAAHADQVLAAAAPQRRAEQLARRAAALEMKLNPEAVTARKEQARRDRGRVETRRERSGNASLSGRELTAAAAMASKAHIDAVAAQLHGSGLFDATLDGLRLLAFTDLLQGRNPLDRIADVPAAGQPGTSGSGPAGPGPEKSRPAPLPALVNLLIPAGTLLGWSAAPAQAGSWGLLDREEAREVASAAARHPRTRWCATIVGPDGTAQAHGCARGQHPGLLDDLEPQPPPAQLAELLRRLGLVFTAVAAGTCDHAGAETRYSPSRRLRHVVRARTATCDAPGCDSPAAGTDLDHTVPWPAGPTDQCNLAPRCRTHHRAKQAPDWTVERLAPGVSRWIMPSGRSHVTRPTRYDC